MNDSSTVGPVAVVTMTPTLGYMITQGLVDVIMWVMILWFAYWLSKKAGINFMKMFIPPEPKKTEEPQAPQTPVPNPQPSPQTPSAP